MSNVTVPILSVDLHDQSQEKALDALVIVLLLLSIWIIIVNSIVLSCLVIRRKGLNTFVNLQMLSFSITDLFVGISGITTTLTYEITTVFPYVEVCAAIWYGYCVSQTANLFHGFEICIHRLITVKRKTPQTESSTSNMLKRLLFQVFLVWVTSICLIAIPYLLFIKWGKPLKGCSLPGIFDSDYIPFMTSISVIFVTPQLGMTLVYAYMFWFLLRTWRRINNIRNSKEPYRASTLTDESKQGLNQNVNNFNEDGTGPLQVTCVASCSNTEKSNQSSVDPVTAVTPDLLSVTGAHHQDTKLSSDSDYLSESNSGTSKSKCNQAWCSVATRRPRSGLGRVSESYGKLPIPEYGDAINANPPNESGGIKQMFMVSDGKVATKEPLNSMRKKPRNIKLSHFNGQHDVKAKGFQCGINQSGLKKELKQDSSSRTLAIKGQRDVLVTIGLLLLVLNVFMSPLNAIVIFELINDGLLTRKVKFGLFALSLMNSALNPVIYTLRIKPFRESLKTSYRRIISKLTCCVHNQ